MVNLDPQFILEIRTNSGQIPPPVAVRRAGQTGTTPRKTETKAAETGTESKKTGDGMPENRDAMGQFL